MFKKLILNLIRFYQKYLFFGPVCRFAPTCSEYTYQAIKRYGIISGSWQGLRRIVRCHPWNRGGEDPVR
ncbi:MAG: membrane protein insertion efficiency factor YidD [Candidatus Shapirobacteria bacterium]